MKNIFLLIVVALFIFPSKGLSSEKNTEAEEDARLVAANVMFDKAYECPLKGEFDDALEAYSAAIFLNKNYGMAYNYRGHIYYLQRKYTEAFEDFNRAIAVEPVYAG